MMQPRCWLVIFLLWLAFAGYSQRWTVMQESQVPVTGRRDIVPGKYALYSVEADMVREILLSAPGEDETAPGDSRTLLTVGLPDGTTDVFRIISYDMMEPGLATKYSGIRTYRGVSLTDPYRRIRADWTKNGLRAVIRDPDGFMYIDPFQRGDLTHRIAYYRKDYVHHDDWTCDVRDTSSFDEKQLNTNRQGDCMFRTYRLAQATTGEYSNYFDAFSSSQSDIVMSEVVTVVNRVNEVYEADVAIRLVLIDNTDLVFYYNPSADPFTNDDGFAMLGQNQNNMTTVIGGANYDIGHVFSTGGGGVASLGSVCSSSNKARGVTGGSNPVGDPFSIDYVAHEMGHQFGGSHTFNGTAANCGGGNRTASSAFEPGSGSTIMAYAGICGNQDIQPHSDPYFHARSILQIANHTANTSCEGFITMNNTAPVANALPNYTIPKSTPFVLTADATDANNDPLLYCWEQYDLETTSTEPPASNDTDGPLFRSFDYVSSPSRYFPRLSDLTANNNYTWEVLSSVTRVIKFRMTVKDYHDIGGCTDEDDVDVSVTSTAGPFVVTSQNSSTTWMENSTQTITWDVANTTASPVSCANVEIRFSTDGGFTYPVVLAASEPNDGSATIVVPAGTTSQGRVMVKAVNNIFFDINNANITVEPCVLMVTQLSGSGSGTLPGAISCANPGEIILLSGALAGQTINIGNTPLMISKDVTIQGLVGNITITGSGLRVFEVSPGVDLSLLRLQLVAGTSTTGGAIVNQGNLVLSNVQVKKNASISGANLIQNIAGTMEMSGSCSVIQ